MYSEVCDLVQLRKDPTLKQMYDHYYQSAVKRADIDVKSSTGSRDSYRLAEVTAPNSMDEEDIDALKKATKKRGLSTKVQNGGKLELNGWVEAFMSILKSYSDDPEMLVTTMDELIWNYCWAFWNLSDNDLEAYISDHKNIDFLIIYLKSLIFFDFFCCFGYNCLCLIFFGYIDGKK